MSELKQKAPQVESSTTQTTTDANSTNEIEKPPKRNKKRKEMAPRSKAWEHFTKHVEEDGSVTATCIYCGKVYNGGNGTTVLNSHLNVCSLHPHRIETDEAQAKLVPWKFDQKDAMDALCYMIIVDELPFKFVEREGFKNFIACICPMFKIPSRWTIQRHVYQMYLDEKLKLRQLFQNGQRVCITTDTWTSIQRINYMCITGHFVDGDWKLNKRILNFCPISSHKGDDIGKEIETCLHEWGIKRVFTVTVDNASSNDVAITYLKGKLVNWEACIAKCEYMHMRCIAHILNLIVCDGLKDSYDVVEKARNYVRYIRQSPSRLQKFHQCVEIEQIECKKSLCLDVPTRWNSTYLMLSTAEKFERAFDRFDDEKDPYFKFNMNALGGTLSHDDWEEIRALCEVLKHFYDATLRISGTLYVTSNALWTEILHLHWGITKIIEHGENNSFKAMGAKMKMKFNKYWGDPKKMNKLIYISIIFDPREKDVVMEDIFTDFYGPNQGSMLFGIVKNEIVNLFNEYKARLQPQNVDDTHESSEHVEDNESDFSKPRQLLRKRYKKGRVGDSSTRKRSELELYLNEAALEINGDFDVLRWWRLNSERFPILSEMARDVLAIPVSTVASESAFSTGGRVLDSFRSSLTPKIVESLVCSQDWLRQSFNSLSIEEDISELEEFEKDMGIGVNESGTSSAGLRS